MVYDFCETRAGRHAAAFLEGWAGTLLVDDFAGYKQLMGGQLQEAGCWAHARRKFFELHAANKSQIAEQALALIGQIYEIERQAQVKPPRNPVPAGSRESPQTESLHEEVQIQ